MHRARVRNGLIARIAEVETLAGAGDGAAALALARQLLAEVGTGEGLPADPALVQALNRLGIFFFDQSLAAEALAAYAPALALLERAAPDDRVARATLHNNLGQAQHQLQQLEAARGHLETSLSLKQEAGDSPLSVAITQDNLASVLASLGQTEAALALHEAALQTFERLRGPMHADVATALGNLGRLYAQNADPRRARACYLRSLDIHLCVGGVDSPGALVSAVNLIRLALTQHDDRLAGDLCDVLLAIGGDRPGVEQHRVAVALLEVAGDAFRAFSLGLAERLATRARVLLAASVEPGSAPALAAARLLAQVYLAKGNLAAAETLQLRLLEAPGRTPDAQAQDFIDFGKSLRGRGPQALASAQAMFERALDLIRAQPAPDPELLASALGNLGQAHFDANQLPAAERCYGQALAAIARHRRPHELPWLLHNQALLHYHQGHHEEALPLFRRARALWVRRLGRQHPFVATTEADLALLHWARGDAAAAARAFATAARLRAPELARRLALGSESERLETAHAGIDVLYKVVSFHAASGAAATLAATLLVQRKGAVQAAMLRSSARLRRALNPAARVQLDRLADLQRQIGEQVAAETLYGGSADPGAVAALQAQAGQLERELGQRSAFGQAALAAPTLAQVRAALPAGAVLVDYLRWAVFEPRRTGAARSWRGWRYAALVLRRRGAPHWFDLGEADAIDAAASGLRAALSEPDASGPGAAAAAAQLGALILAPIEAAIAGARQLIVAPDGALNLVPFGVLGLPALGERARLSLVAGASELIAADEALPPLSAPVAIVDPDFDAGIPAALPASGAGWEPLPGTRAEADAMHALWPDVQVVSGADATTDALRRLERPALLHIATHGHFSPPQARAPHWQTDTLRIDDDLLIVQRAGPAARDDAMHQGGLVLAGANRGGGGRAMGLVSAAELAQLDLRGTALVVLSACDTGLGSAALGAEFAGLRRAFAMAGSRSQLTGLWAVDDEATAALMAAFYGALHRGRGRAEALREARPRWAHPSYWAAFVLWGDAAPLPAALRGGATR